MPMSSRLSPLYQPRQRELQPRLSWELTYSKQLTHLFHSGANPVWVWFAISINDLHALFNRIFQHLKAVTLTNAKTEGYWFVKFRNENSHFNDHIFNGNGWFSGTNGSQGWHCRIWLGTLRTFFTFANVLLDCFFELSDFLQAVLNELIT